MKNHFITKIFVHHVRELALTRLRWKYIHQTVADVILFKSTIKQHHESLLWAAFLCNDTETVEVKAKVLRQHNKVENNSYDMCGVSNMAVGAFLHTNN